MATVYVTHNFVENLNDVKHYLKDNDAEFTFDDLKIRLDTVITNLELFPEMGINFLIKNPLSLMGKAKNGLVSAFAEGFFLREYIFDNYIILYANKVDQIYLLSIKHHRQLSYDFMELRGLNMPMSFEVTGN